MTAKLRRVLVRGPRSEDRVAWRAYGWRAEPDPVKAAEEHEAFCTLLADGGAEVVSGRTPIGLCPEQRVNMLTDMLATTRS